MAALWEPKGTAQGKQCHQPQRAAASALMVTQTTQHMQLQTDIFKEAEQKSSAAVLF